MKTTSKMNLSSLAAILLLCAGTASAESLASTYTAPIAEASTNISTLANAVSFNVSTPVAYNEGNFPKEVKNDAGVALCPFSIKNNEWMYLSLSNSTANTVTFRVEISEPVYVPLAIDANYNVTEGHIEWKLLSTTVHSMPAAKDGKPSNLDIDLGSIVGAGKTVSAVIIPTDGSALPTANLTRATANANGEPQIGTPTACFRTSDTTAALTNIANILLPVTNLIPQGR